MFDSEAAYLAQHSQAWRWGYEAGRAGCGVPAMPRGMTACQMRDWLCGNAAGCPAAPR